MVLAHDITEIRQGEFKGPAFRRGHVIRREDLCHLQRLGKERIRILRIGEDEVHEDDAAITMAEALMGEGLSIQGPPREGKVNLVAAYDGLLKVDREALLAFNMHEDLMCASMHTNTLVNGGQVIAGTRAIPLVLRRETLETACAAARGCPGSVLSVRRLRRPRVGVVITGSEVFTGKVRDAFAPIIRAKVQAVNGEITGLHYTPDDRDAIRGRLEELIAAGADFLITTGGMSVDPDDVTRFAIRDLGVADMHYGSAVLPGAMVLVGTVQGECGAIPVLGIPACGMYHKITIFDLLFPRLLAGENITRRDLAELGHGGMCLGCEQCRYPVCPFGKC